ncbi:hypothetical protein LTR08_002841 [Meristemomyces frigidus]|nr:hypothetical protein LTR08_002841 [Meristemomyces frigidus]
MAPTKKDGGEKEVKLSPEQSAALIMDYLRKQNRPYSATDISTNLKNRVTKAAAAKLLKDMHERKEIEGRAAGKQIVYHSIQVSVLATVALSRVDIRLTATQEEADEDALAKVQAMDAETTRFREATISLKTEEKELRLALREGTSQVSVTELRISVATLGQERAEVSGRLAKLKSGNLKPVGIEEREKVNVDHRRWQKAARARKKIRHEMWEEIAAGHEKKEHADLKEELGLEF